MLKTLQMCGQSFGWEQSLNSSRKNVWTEEYSEVLLGISQDLHSYSPVIIHKLIIMTSKWTHQPNINAYISVAFLRVILSFNASQVVKIQDASVCK